MLGADRPTLESRYGPLPRNWECLPFGAEPVQAFLASLDVYVYVHASTWTEAFGRGRWRRWRRAFP